MGTKKRPEGTVPWIPGFRYSALLPALSINLLVEDTLRSTTFYRDVFNGEIRYQDVDFAAARVGPAEVMIHADHTHDTHPWVQGELAAGAPRGVGAQFRLLGIDPDELHARAIEAGAHVVFPPTDKGHGWREILLRDPDGYEWACGVLIPPAAGPFGPQAAPAAAASPPPPPAEVASAPPPAEDPPPPPPIPQPAPPPAS